MLFCPSCGNLLLVEAVGNLRFFCQTCPYLHNVKEPMAKSTTLAKKDVDDVLGGEEAWKNVDQTDTRCPKCSHGRAYFFQLQIRSADEPMTTFYKCVKCGSNWNDGS